MSLKLNRKLVTVDEYHLMAEVGILTAKDKVELLNGEIIYKRPIGSKHAYFVDIIGQLIIGG